jgi:hypothetical protein
MNRVLILYPLQFQSQSKFDRKVAKIIANLENFCVLFPSDPCGLIRSFFERMPANSVPITETADWLMVGLTHAIIFDDGEEFPEATQTVLEMKIPTRLIKIAITRVVNIKKEAKYAVIKSSPDYEYVGRGSYWGNPYSMFEAGDSREEVIRKFKYDFDNEKFAKKEKSEVYKLAGKRLGCFCKPDACHGDVLANFLNEWDDGE